MKALMFFNIIIRDIFFTRGMFLFKIKNYSLALIFSVIFYYSYVHYLNFYWDYLNFRLFRPPLIVLIFSYVIAAMPILLYRGFKSISSFISIFIFIILYIPTIFTFALALNDSIEQIFFIQFVFFVSMCLFFLADRFNLTHSKIYLFKFISFRFILVLTIIFSLYTFYIYKGNLAFVSFSDVYIHRFANIDIGTDVVSRYLTTWLSSFFIPICLLYGIFNKKYYYFIIGGLSCALLYMATASKIAVLMPVIMLGLYYLLMKTGLKGAYSVMILSLSILTLGLLLIASNQSVDSPFSMAANILILRVVGTGGLLNVLYYEYFLSHPNTYYSHIGPINTITGSYPYGSIPIGEVVGQHYWPWVEGMNASANFWAMDGIASVGIIGVLVISVVFFFLLIFLNTIAKGYNKIFLVLLFVPFLSTLLNASLFQTMWSGGGFFTMVFLFILKSGKTSIYS